MFLVQCTNPCGMSIDELVSASESHAHNNTFGATSRACDDAIVDLSELVEAQRAKLGEWAANKFLVASRFLVAVASNTPVADSDECDIDNDNNDDDDKTLPDAEEARERVIE